MQVKILSAAVWLQARLYDSSLDGSVLGTYSCAEIVAGKKSWQLSKWTRRISRSWLTNLS